MCGFGGRQRWCGHGWSVGGIAVGGNSTNFWQSARKSSKSVRSRRSAALTRAPAVGRGHGGRREQHKFLAVGAQEHKKCAVPAGSSVRASTSGGHEYGGRREQHIWRSARKSTKSERSAGGRLILHAQKTPLSKRTKEFFVSPLVTSRSALSRPSGPALRRRRESSARTAAAACPRPESPDSYTNRCPGTQG